MQWANQSLAENGSGVKAMTSAKIETTLQQARKRSNIKKSVTGVQE
jgi:hypothetical protein